MALSSHDRKNLSKDQQRRIEKATRDYESAKARGDKDAMNKAHSTAEKIRSSKKYSGGSDGTGYKGGVTDHSWIGDGYTKKRNQSSSRSVNYPKTALSSSSSSGSRSSRRSSKESSPINSYIDEINRLAEMRKQQAIAGLTKSRDSALSNLNREKEDIQPRYYNARNDANTQSKLGAKSFAEYIANRGLANSGENTQARLMQNVALQGQIGELKQQEQNAFDEIARRVTDVNNAYSSDVASARAGVDAQTMQNLIAEHQRIDAIKREQERYNREFDYRQNRDSVLDDRYDTQYRDSRSDIDYARNYRTERDSVLDNRYGTEYADRRSDIDYARSPDNPAYQAQILSNKLAEMNLDYLPEKLKAEIASINRRNTSVPKIVSPKTQYLNNIYEKLANGQPLTADERDIIGLENTNVENAPSKNDIIAGTYDAIDSRIVNGDTSKAMDWLKNNRTDIVKKLGINEYNKMVSYLKDAGSAY